MAENDPVNEPRAKRTKTDRHGRSAAFEKLKQLKGNKSKYKYEVSEMVDNVYEEVDEKEYTKKVLERQDDDWIVDDDGCGYVEDGREIFDDDLDDESIIIASRQSKKDGKRGVSGKKSVPRLSAEAAGSSGIRNMLMKMPAKKRTSAEVKLEDDDILGDIMQELHNEGTSPAASSQPRALSPRSYMRSLANSSRVKAAAKPTPKPAKRDIASAWLDQVKVEDIVDPLLEADTSCTSLLPADISSQTIENFDSDDENFIVVQSQRNCKKTTKRSSRTTQAQFKSMLDFMTGNEMFSRGKLTGTEGNRIRTKKWMKLTKILNGDPNGPEKDAARWQKAWTDWKCAARKKAARVRAYNCGAGGGQPIPRNEQPTALDEELLSFLGAETALGYVNVHERGDAGNKTPEQLTEPVAGCSRTMSPGEYNSLWDEDSTTEIVQQEASPSTKRNVTSAATESHVQAPEAKKKRKVQTAPEVAPPLSVDTLNLFAENSARTASAVEDIAKALDGIRDQQERQADAFNNIANAFIKYLERH